MVSAKTLKAHRQENDRLPAFLWGGGTDFIAYLERSHLELSIAAPLEKNGLLFIVKKYFKVHRDSLVLKWLAGGSQLVE